MARVLIAGCGYLGLRLGLDLVNDGHRVLAARRDVSSLPGSVAAVAVDLADPAAVGRLPAPFDTVFYTAAAGAATPEAYEKAYVQGPGNLVSWLEGLPSPAPRFIFCSSTSVFGEDDGQRVDEDTTPRPTSFRGEITLRGEAAVRASVVPSVVLRLGGIYGPGRTRMVEAVRGGAATPRQRDRFGNRIHRDDAARALAHLMRLDTGSDLYLGVDQEPARLSSVEAWLAAELGVSAPPLPETDATIGGKRCSSARLRASGFVFRYPTFREGYAPLLAPR